ncbi:MAG TPA: hypothetical protein VG500_16565 [Gemmatimonadales bacterium]|nr:hypothetical protein [Gemmatimonadales bacterium]
MRLSQTTATNSGYAEADSAAREAVRFARASEDSRLLADALELSGRVLYSCRINLAEGDYEEPLRLSTEALELRREAGDVRGIAGRRTTGRRWSTIVAPWRKRSGWGPPASR